MIGVQPLCGEAEGCRRVVGHPGEHDQCPSEVFRFLREKDRDKLTKAGFATPRGGAKGAYQNHVLRSNRVIIPFERRSEVDLAAYKGGYVFRLFPNDCFSSGGVLKPEFVGPDAPIKIGINAYVLYRRRSDLQDYPPLENWQPCALLSGGQPTTRRGVGVKDVGQYVIRVPALGKQKPVREGAVQGIFAPEYADEETNFLCQVVLAWLIVRAVDSPYTTSQATHLTAILATFPELADEPLRSRGVLRDGFTSCPLCNESLPYEDFHRMIAFENDEGTRNAGIQVEGATRSTIVNLFHLLPLNYRISEHRPANVAWGHAKCNTLLGQRRCFSMDELQLQGLKVGWLKGKHWETFGWISAKGEMIRSPKGGVWIQLVADSEEVNLDHSVGTEENNDT